MKLSAREWSRPSRWLVIALLALGSFLLLGWAKAAFLETYLATRPWSGALLLGSFVLLMEGARRALDVTFWDAWRLGIMFAVVLFLFVVETPFPYEVAQLAHDLPHPEGTSAPDLVETSPVFDRGHVSATAVFRYPVERDLAALTNDTAAAYEAEGWTLTGVRIPEGNGPTDFGYVAAKKGPLSSSCTLGQRDDFQDAPGPMRTLGCLLTV